MRESETSTLCIVSRGFSTCLPDKLFVTDPGLDFTFVAANAVATMDRAACQLRLAHADAGDW